MTKEHNESTISKWTSAPPDVIFDAIGKLAEVTSRFKIQDFYFHVKHKMTNLSLVGLKNMNIHTTTIHTLSSTTTIHSLIKSHH